jgi:threonine/homoserine/homoserine lactone efflux protein
MSIEFLLTAFIVCASPGIGVVYTLSSTLGGGLRAGLWANLGCTIATVFHLVVAMAGLAAILHTSATVFQAVEIAGVIYLIWMAWAVLQEKGSMAISPSAPKPALDILWRGILLNILNPKLPLFFVAFLPQFLPPNAGLGALMELGLGFTAMTFATFGLYSIIAASGRRAVLGNAALLTAMRRAFALSFAALGVKLALQRA